MKSLSSYIPFAKIPSVQERPTLSPLLRQWIYGFYDPEQSDSILFLRLHLLNLALNFAICCLFVLPLVLPLSQLNAIEPARAASNFLSMYPRQFVPWLLLANVFLALVSFFLQSPTLSLRQQTEMKADALTSQDTYSKGSTGHYLGAMLFSVVVLCHLDAIPRYFLRHKLYAGVVDVAQNPLGTMVCFAIVYVFLFQLFIVNAFSFCIVALSRNVLLRITSHQ